MRKLGLALACCVLGALLAGCGPDYMKVTANFADVGDLSNNAPVTMADIQVGKVSDIHLAGNEAVVTLALDPEAKIPEGVTARVRRTSVLGERIVDIVLPEDLSDSTPLLHDGDHIDQTIVRSDLEDLVEEGSDLFGAITASQLAVMIEEGARGFGGQGAELGNLLRNYGDIIHAYEGRSKKIVELIGSLKRFNQTLATESEAHERAVVNTAKSINVLQEESIRLERAVIALGRLARGSRSILTAHVGDMERFFRNARSILAILVEKQDDIARILKWAPGHNYNTQAVEFIEFNQIVQDFVFCGMNDDPKNDARTCNPGKN